LLSVIIVLASIALPGQALPAETPDAPDLDRILAEYNAGIERSEAFIESLWVEQVIIDPQDDGTNKEARAVLKYGRDGRMEREVTKRGVPYMVGEYTLGSLLGPTMLEDQYRIAHDGVEMKEGVLCHRLSVEALVRDADHFDGTLWVSCERPGPVRIIGEVSDPPFPAVRVALDKAFQQGPYGVWLVRRHTGEAEVSLLVRRRGVRHIFYDGYRVVAGPGRAPADSTGATGPDE